MTLTEGLVRLIRAKPVGSADLAKAALFVLDAMANALAARNTEPGTILRRWAKEQGRGQGRDAGRDAFLMGGLIHILETDDLHRASVVHPGCVVVPAAFAVAGRDGAQGRAVLEAVLHGYEACCRVGMAVGPAHYRIWHNTATCGPFGSAMAAAALGKLDEGQAVHALGNAGTQAAGLWQFLETGAMSKHMHAGRAAEAGVVAAGLAGLGFTGPPAILEGDKGFFAGACPDADPAAVLGDAEAPWQVHDTSIKPWPSCRHTHPVIDAALELHGDMGQEDAAEIQVVTYAAALDVCDRSRPQSEYEAKFSLQHCAAVALRDGEVGFSSFDDKARKRVAALAARTIVAVGEPFAADYPEAWGARLAVTTAGGRRLEAGRTHCKGDPELALSDAELTDKARYLLAYAGLEDGAARALIDAILALAEDGPLPGLDFQ
ncbi:MAG: MmgE/PrpD family protein [Rhodospirillales bacterium]|jgi:2-methylcitrate dehydratase PrpD|nr:MmgE/PrpD family protein [Rhodospirillales bacterium]MDP6884784.1 MmgE/PrpD family protein [Rhodospirillales bacterium]